MEKANNETIGQVEQGSAPKGFGASKRTVLEGTVVSHKMDKTVVVEVERFVKHARYGKYIRVRKRVKADDPKNAYKTGDRVFITPTRPLSKDKRYEVTTLS